MRFIAMNVSIGSGCSVANIQQYQDSRDSYSH